MQVYPHQTALILTDSIFIENGGQTGSFTAAQRNNAYRIAEQQATTHLHTLLLPTIVTGTFGYSPRIVTDYGYVHRVLSVNLLSRDSFTECTLQSDSGCVFMWEDTYGYLDVGCLMNVCHCNRWIVPYQAQIVYEAGLPTGVASQPAMLLALTMAAQISLNEMIFPSQNEGTGDVGIEQFSSLDYSEKRKAFARNAFGSSAKAAKIASLINGTIKPARPTLMLR